MIKSLTVEDVGEYTCIAENVRTTTELEIKGGDVQIELEDHDKDQVGIKGQDVTLTVTFKAEAGSKPKVIWTFNGKEITASEKVVMSVSRKTTSMTLKAVEAADCGGYEVKVSNSVNEACAAFNLTIKDKPSPPRGPAGVEWNDDNHMILRWNAPESDGGSAITEYIVERREVGKKSWKQVGTTASSTTSLEIRGLKKNCSYNFR